MKQNNKLPSFSPNKVSLTEAAEAHFLRSLQSASENASIRIGIREAGCSGYEYFFELSDTSNDDDYIHHFSGKRLFIDKSSIDFIKGSEIDYVDDGINQGIRFNNPNAKAVCGCGESFTI